MWKITACLSHEIFGLLTVNDKLFQVVDLLTSHSLTP
jgi:hypothetical protein